MLMILIICILIRNGLQSKISEAKSASAEENTYIAFSILIMLFRDGMASSPVRLKPEPPPRNDLPVFGGGLM